MAHTHTHTHSPNKPSSVIRDSFTEFSNNNFIVVVVVVVKVSFIKTIQSIDDNESKIHTDYDDDDNDN